MAPERIFSIYKRREFTVNQITTKQKQSKADSKPNKFEKSKKSQIFSKSTMRCKFTDQDVHIMENFYKNEPYPTTDQRFELAEQLGKPVKSVSGWFAGRRRKQVQNGDDLSALSKPINQKDTDGLLARLHGTRSIRNIISTNQHQTVSELSKPVKSAETDEMIKGAGLDVIKPGDPDSPDLKTIRKILDMDTEKMKPSTSNRPERILDSVYIPIVKKPLPSISCLRQPVFKHMSAEPQAALNSSSQSEPEKITTQSEVVLLKTQKPTLAQFDEDTDEEIDVLSISEDTEKKMEKYDKTWAKKEQKKPSFEMLNEEPIDLTSPIRPIPRPAARQTPVSSLAMHSNVLRPRTLQPNTVHPYPSQNLIRQNPPAILPKPSLPPFTAHGQFPVATNAAAHLALRVQPAGKVPYGFQAAGISRQQMVQQLDYLNKQIAWKRRLLNHYISTQQAHQATIHQPTAPYFNQLLHKQAK